MVEIKIVLDKIDIMMKKYYEREGKEIPTLIDWHCSKHKHVKTTLSTLNCCSECVREKQLISELKQLDGIHPIIDYKTAHRESKMPLVYRDASLDRWHERYINNLHKLEIKRSLQSYNFDHDLVFYGNVGAGKTYSAAALLNKVISIQKSCYYILYSQLLRIKINDYKLFEKLENVDFLVIDEIGINTNDKQKDSLYEIFVTRHANEKQTLLITNLSRDDFFLSCPAALRSRLVENCLTLNFDWEDYRKNA